MRWTALFVTLLCFWGCKPRVDAPVETRRAAKALSPAEAVDLDPASDVVRVELTAARAKNGYTYNGTSPGPTIRAKLGDTVQVILRNDLGIATTIHWHGVKVPFDMDGVTWMRDPVMPGETFEYRFVVNQAGTFWYHPHFDTESQVDNGLYGALIVEDPTDPVPDAELVVIFDDEAEHKLTSPGHGHGRAVARWLVNGRHSPVFTARGGTVVRARFINASNVAFAAMRFPSIRHIGSDQGLLPALQQPERLLLAPGDRADVEWLIGRDGFPVMFDPYSLNGGDVTGEPFEVFRVEVKEPQDAPMALSWPFSNAPVTADPKRTDILYAFAGSDRTGRWFINGEVFPNVTIEALTLNQTAVIEVRNLSPTEHPFHIHGLSFEVLSINGTPPAHQTIEDTLNVRIYDRLRLLVRADNPGDWMTHCHILPHAGDGMMTVLRVEE